MAIKVINGLGVTDAPFSPVGRDEVAFEPTVSKEITTDGPKVVITTPLNSRFRSKVSGPAPFDTFFHDFRLVAEPVYNFWVSDEETNESWEMGDRRTSDIPRYVHLRWTPAPDLTNPLDSNDIRYGSRTANITKTEEYAIGGVVFSPGHLADFANARRSAVNGYVAPGVLRTIVDLADAGRVSYVDPLMYFDEDAFLVSQRTEGVSAHELHSNYNSLTNGVVTSTRLLGSRMSVEGRSEADQFFHGKVAVSPSLGDQGTLRVDSIAPSSPAIGFVSKVANFSETTLVNQVKEIMQETMETDNVQPSDGPAQAVVNFVDPGLDGLITAEKVSQITSPEQAENTVAIAQVLPSFIAIGASPFNERLPDPEPPSLPVPPGVKPYEYVGYVIEKYKMDRSGVFALVETIDIPGREYDEYIDTHVTYGATYRYRIQAVFRWVRPASDQLAHEASYFLTQWGKRWAYATVIDTMPPAHPDEFSVRTESDKGRIVLTMKLPYNPQGDISGMVILRKVIDSSGRDVEEWKQVGPTFPPRNVFYFDEDVESFQESGGREYVYTSVCITHHDEMSTFSEQYSARINSDHANSGEFPVKFVSQGGVKPGHHGAFAVIPFKRYFEEVISRESFVLEGRNAFGTRVPTDSDYIMRIESLDTGEVKDYIIAVRYVQEPPSVKLLDSIVSVPDAPRKDETRIYRIADDIQTGDAAKLPELIR